MKKLFLTIGLVLAAGILFTAQSPSLDGRALVADPGVFPKGLFAKTVGYLPGDTISVTNPANAERVDILVIGSLDPSEGVAIMLSPEAASALNIKKNSNNLVKLTKRNGNVDEVANGSAVIATSSAPAEAAPVEATPVEEAAPVEEVAPVADEAAEEKPLSEVIEEAVANGESVEEAEQEAVAAAEEKAADKMFDAEDAATEEAEEVAVAEEAAEEAAEDVSNEEYPEYEAVKDELVEDELANEVPEENEDEFVEADVKDEVPEETVSEEVADAEVVEGEPIEDEYEAIVLVPSESKSPESSLVDEPLIIEEEKEIEVKSFSPASGVAYIKDFGELESQKYYVQIAVYKSSENVEQIASQYGSRYPITVVQQGSKSPVLVGPLTVDEYGVVLERFKSYGFKDAFIKIGK